MAMIWPIILMSAHAGLAQVPNFNLNPTCQAAAVSNGFQRPQGACMRDEHDARAQLEKQWTSYSLSERRRCTIMTQTGAPPSYVELLTCLQMAKEASRLPASELEGPLG